MCTEEHNMASTKRPPHVGKVLTRLRCTTQVGKREKFQVYIDKDSMAYRDSILTD